MNPGYQPDPVGMARGMVEDLLDAVYKYDGAVPVATALGCLVIAGAQLLQDALKGEEDEEEDDGE